MKREWSSHTSVVFPGRYSWNKNQGMVRIVYHLSDILVLRLVQATCSVCSVNLDLSTDTYHLHV